MSEKSKQKNPNPAKPVDVLTEDKKKSASPAVKVDQVKAKARFLRISPRKVKLVIDLIRGLDVEQALDQLKFVNKKATRFVDKLLNSALANAEHNFNLKKNQLFIKHIVANQGPVLHRWKAAAFGQAHPIRKRSTHLELILGIKEDLAKAGKNVKTKASQKLEKNAKKVKPILKKELKKEEVI